MNVFFIFHFSIQPIKLMTGTLANINDDTDGMFFNFALQVAVQSVMFVPVIVLGQTKS